MQIIVKMLGIYKLTKKSCLSFATKHIRDIYIYIFSLPILVAVISHVAILLQRHGIMQKNCLICQLSCCSNEL